MSGGGAGVEELQEKLDTLYCIKTQINMKAIILQDTSIFSYDKKKLSSDIERDILDIIIGQVSSGTGMYTKIVAFAYPELGVLGMYNWIKKNFHTVRFGFQHAGMVNKCDFTRENYFKTTDFERLDININTIEDKGLILRYIENKDVEEAIFNTRMEIYNLTHKNRDIEHLHREIEMLKSTKSKSKEDCCDKLKRRIERLEINLSRVDGMVRELEPTQIVHTQLSPTSPRRTANKANKNTPRKTKKNSAMSLMPRHLYYGRPELPE